MSEKLGTTLVLLQVNFNFNFLPVSHCYCRSHYFFWQKLLLSSSGDGFQIVMDENPYCSWDLLVWPLPCFALAYRQPSGRLSPIGACKASSTVISVRSIIRRICGMVLIYVSLGVSKTVLGEVSYRKQVHILTFQSFCCYVQITDSSNIADAFALIQLMWTSGITIGYFSLFLY